jgi:acyl-CoA reductase-like NAD-dependent aldehyde dehydrogenase
MAEYRMLVGGERVAGARGGYAVVNPATEEVVGEAPEASAAASAVLSAAASSASLSTRAAAGALEVVGASAFGAGPMSAVSGLSASSAAVVVVAVGAARAARAREQRGRALRALREEGEQLGPLTAREGVPRDHARDRRDAAPHRALGLYGQPREQHGLELHAHGHV